MRLKFLTLLLSLFCTAALTQGISYPKAKKTDQVDILFGHRIADPYRWLEDSDAPETRAWIEAENAVTAQYLNAISESPKINAHMTRLWNFERYGVPTKEGPWTIFTKNSGLEGQAVVYKAKSLKAKAEVLLDPNTWSKDGTVALSSFSFSDDGRYVAYAKSVSGSDWIEWHIRETASNKDLDDRIQWSKFSDAAWLKDGSGFFYSAYDEPKNANALLAVNKNQKLFFHKLHTQQSDDLLIYARPDHPDWEFGSSVTEDGHYLVINQSESTENKNRVFIKDLRKKASTVMPFLDAFDAEYQVLGNDGDLFYVKTNYDAPRSRIVAIRLSKPKKDHWKEVVAQDSAVLDAATMVNNQFVASYMVDAHSSLRVFDLKGKRISEVQLPTLGTSSLISGKRKDKEGFYRFSSFTYPTTIYHYNFRTHKSTLFKKPDVNFDASKYETHQVFYPSKDGTKIPMFLVYKKGLVRDGQNPTLLYGYGGFNSAEQPTFKPNIATWLDMGGVYALANLRGGNEYGQAWYDAGRLKNKQNVFDDFIAAAEFLIKEQITSTPKLAINGRSNGGLLVGATLVQRPDLFGAAIPAVGVMDMLRYHKFTIGWGWKSDYGDPDTKEGLEMNLAYSPLHNIKAGTVYPPTFITTGDHDDRVVPGHSFKFAATLQAAQAGPAPILIRIDTKAGHGSGKSTQKQIEEHSDGYAFLAKELHMTLPSDF